MPDFKIAEAYIELTTRGDTSPDVEREKQRADASSRARAINKGREDDYLSRQLWQNAQNREKAKAQLQRENEKAVTEFERKQAQHQQEQKLQRISQIQSLQTAGQRWQTLVGHTTQAFGTLPLVHGAAAIAQQAIAGFQQHAAKAITAGKTESEAMAHGRRGAVGAAAMQAGVGAVGYGIQGAGIAAPQEMARLDYQSKRLQAIVGQHFTPAIEFAGNALDKLGNMLGSKGTQLLLPQYSDFAAIRDRLQISALQGLGGGGGAAGAAGQAERDRFQGTKIGAGLGIGAASVGMPWLGAGALGVGLIADAIRGIAANSGDVEPNQLKKMGVGSSSLAGLVANAFREHFGIPNRSVMDALDPSK